MEIISWKLHSNEFLKTWFIFVGLFVLCWSVILQINTQKLRLLDIYFEKNVDIHVIKGRDSYSSMGMIIIIKYNYAYIDLENCSKITNMHIIKEYELIYARVINTVKCPEKRSRWLWYRFSGFLLVWKAVLYHQCSAIPMIRKYFWNHKYNMLICS